MAIFYCGTEINILKFRYLLQIQLTTHTINSLEGPICPLYYRVTLGTGLQQVKKLASPLSTVRRDCDTLIGSLSSDVFERRTSTGSEPFPLLKSVDATVFVLPSVLILTETICPKICSKSRLKSAKRLFPVDVRRSKTSLLKLPNDSKGR